MSSPIEVAVVTEAGLPAHIESMNEATRAWTMAAARGECGWICSDCCGSDPKGMPDECFYNDARCTAIIQRDKQASMKEGNEPQ